MATHESMLDGLTLDELRALEATLRDRSRTTEQEEREAAFQALELLAEERGLSRAELRQHFGGRRSRRPAGAPKYRHPETGQTWSGRGRKPDWVSTFEDAGGRLSDIAIG